MNVIKLLIVLVLLLVSIVMNKVQYNNRKKKKEEQKRSSHFKMRMKYAYPKPTIAVYAPRRHVHVDKTHTPRQAQHRVRDIGKEVTRDIRKEFDTWKRNCEEVNRVLSVLH